MSKGPVAFASACFNYISNPMSMQRTVDRKSNIEYRMWNVGRPPFVPSYDIFAILAYSTYYMVHVLNAIAPLFLIIFATAFLQRVRTIGENWANVLNEYALNIGLPVLIFSSLSKARVSFSEQSALIISNSFCIIATFIAAFLIGKIARLEKRMFRTFFLCLIFGNVAYLGIPVLVQISGESILSTASVIIAVYFFWIFTVGTGFLDFQRQHRKKDVFRNIAKNLLKNPLLISVFLGVFLASFAVTLPSVLARSLDMIAASVTPTVLIVIGLFIGKSKIGRLTEWIPVFIFSLMTLVLLPAGFYFGVQLFGFSPSQFSASIIQAGMPLAITPFALADKFGLHKAFIARSIVLSTILSVASLAFWISIFTT